MTGMLAIIPARGGSKRIPYKNIRNFYGQPMIKYAIDAATGSKLFDTIMVSTDDEQIAQIAKQYGAEVPFMRTEKTANDYATTRDVLFEVIGEYKKLNSAFDTLCCIYPCVPFLRSETLIEAHKIFTKKNIDSLMPVVKFSYPIQRALRINDVELLDYVQSEFIESRSQDLEPRYHDVGMFYFYKTDSLFKQNNTIAPFEMKESEIQDIDTEEDWKMAEMKYRILHNPQKA
ncbi:pseudaminic acid cytidylyltransferase [Spirochaetia bacterium]|nr:pseudaminic acid cytidylyltransferase [Spirochaetia bacterium]